jgi:hypothetical protein
MADFPTNPKPSYPIAETPIEPEVLISKHRDGSEQRRLKGPGNKRTFRLPFGSSAPISQSERQAILDHYDGQNGTLTAFDWQHPERTSETYTVRYMEKPTFRLAGYNSYEGDVALQEVES